MNRMLLLLPLFLAANLSFAKRTIVCGKFAGKMPDSITLQYYPTIEASMERSRTVLNTRPEKDAGFHFVLEADRPVDLQIMAGESWLLYDKFILPGDSLYLLFSDAGIDVAGSGSAELAFQFAYDEHFNNRQAVAARQQARDEQPGYMSFARYMSSDLDSRIQFFEAYFKGKEVPEMFRNTYRANEELRFLISLTQLSWRLPVGKEALSDTAYRKYIQDIDYNAPLYALSPEYGDFLRELPYGIWSTQKNASLAKSSADSFFRNQYRIRECIARQHFSGTAYDYALYSILQDQVTVLKRYAGTPSFDEEYRRGDSLLMLLGANLKDKSLYRLAQQQLKSLKETRKPAPDMKAVDLAGNNVKLSDHKGKVVYLDFWATDCLPCRAEIPHARKMQERYKNRKDIVLVYVSLDRDKALLDRFLKEHSFSGLHWRVNGFSSDAAVQYGVTSLPRYVVLDKQGRLVTTDAQRPGADPYTLLDKLLAE